jgi:UDP:flavonoid glycosyltransferase YjiC (YdhE family)
MLDAGRRVVVQGPEAAAVASPNLLRVGRVDHRALFPTAGLVVHHGGAGTTHAACVAGVPSLVVPHVGDQRYWADRLHRLGVAPKPQPVKELDATRLAEAALAAVADPRLRERARALSAILGREDGLGTSIAALEAIGQ